MATATGGTDIVRTVPSAFTLPIILRHDDENSGANTVSGGTWGEAAGTVAGAAAATGAASTGATTARPHFHGIACIAANLAAALFTTSALPTSADALRSARRSIQRYNRRAIGTAKKIAIGSNS